MLSSNEAADYKAAADAAIAEAIKNLIPLVYEPEMVHYYSEEVLEKFSAALNDLRNIRKMLT